HCQSCSVVILIAGMSALAAFAWPSNGETRWLVGSCGALLLSVGAINQSVKLVDIQWLKGGRNSHDGLYEKWNAFSRIHVRELGGQPFGWGLSPRYRAQQEIGQLYLDIDSGAATVITKFD